MVRTGVGHVERELERGRSPRKKSRGECASREENLCSGLQGAHFTEGASRRVCSVPLPREVRQLRRGRLWPPPSD